jgi:hypothetical protein
VAFSSFSLQADTFGDFARTVQTALERRFWGKRKKNKQNQIDASHPVIVTLVIYFVFCCPGTLKSKI